MSSAKDKIKGAGTTFAVDYCGTLSVERGGLLATPAKGTGASRTFKINWELSVSIATLAMMMQQLVEDLMFRIYDIPIDWLG